MYKPTTTPANQVFLARVANSDTPLLPNYVSAIAASRKGRNHVTLTAALLCAFAVSSSAQNTGAISHEQGFTVAPHVQTPLVLKTQPDAACDLHPAGVSDPAQTMRLYANSEGYVRVHVLAKQESQDVQVQLDCGGAVYPLHLHAASSPTADMPAPQTSVPAPQGSQVLPALTEEAAQHLTDQDLMRLGYPSRPDAAASPNRRAKWLDLVSRPITQLPPHVVSRADISHLARVEAGTETSGNWSGLEARGPKRSYMAVTSEWAVPPIPLGELGHTTYSAFWIGLDGDGIPSSLGPAAGKDLVQAGTEQDYTDIGGYSFASYYAWTEIVPNQPTEQELGLSINPGDEIQVEVWIGDSASGPPDQNGGYGKFRITNFTQGQTSLTDTALDGTPFEGSEAEWIMERPCLGLCNTSTPKLADLSAYLVTSMSYASVLRTTGTWVNSGKAANLQITMYNGKDQLSAPVSVPPSSMIFSWYNFH